MSHAQLGVGRRAPQVNKIREVPHHESVLVTHTDQAEVFVWSLERQPNRASDKVHALLDAAQAGCVYTCGDASVRSSGQECPSCAVAMYKHDAWGCICMTPWTLQTISCEQATHRECGSRTVAPDVP